MRFVAAVPLLLLTFAAAPVAAQEAADTVAADAIDRLLWSAAGLQGLLAERDYANALLLGLVSRAAPRDGSLAALASLRPRATALESCRGAADAIGGTACVVRALRPVIPPALAGDLADEAARLAALATRAPVTPRTDAEFWSAGGGDALQAYLETTLESAWRVSRADESGVATRLVYRFAGVHPDAGSREILAEVASLRDLVDRAGGIGTIALDAPLERVLEAHERHLTQSLDGVVGLLRTAPGEAAAAFDARIEWAAQRSFAWLLSGVASAAGAEGAEAAGTIRALGSAAADLRRTAAAFPRSFASLGQSAATVALGANVLGIAANVTSFFSSVAAGGPSAGRQVRALRATMDTLRTELGDRFDRVDASLGELFVTLDGNLARLESAVSAGNRDMSRELLAIHGEVVALGRALDRVDENLHSYMQAGFDRDYNRSLVRCLEHRERHLPPMDVMDFATFTGCLTEFRTRAVRDSRDAILTDLTTPTDEAAVASALADLSAANLGRRLPLLGRVARDRLGNPGMMVRAPIANPVEWAIAAQAYLTVLNDWPDHARAVSTGDLDAILAVGHDVRETLRGITVTGAGTPRRDFFAALLSRYASATDSLDARSARLVREYSDDRLARARADSVIRTIEPDVAGRPHLPPGPALLASVPPELAAAHALGLGALSLHSQVSFSDSTRNENVSRNGRDYDRVYSTTARVRVELRHAHEGRIGVLEAQTPPFRRRTESITGDPRNPRVRRATDHVADPTTHFTAELWPTLARDGTWSVALDSAAVDRVRHRLDATLKTHAAGAVDERVLAACTRDIGELRGEEVAIRRGLDGMTASKALLDAFLLLGLPRSVETHPGLRAALFGEEAVFDRDALCAAVRGGDSVVRLVQVSREPARRLDTLRTAIADVLDRPEHLPEPLELVDRTLRQLEAALEIQALRVVAATGRAR